MVLNLSAQGCAMTTARLQSVSTYVSLDIDLLTETGRPTSNWPAFVGFSDTVWAGFIHVQPDMLMKLRAFALLGQSPNRDDLVAYFTKATLSQRLGLADRSSDLLGLSGYHSAAR